MLNNSDDASTVLGVMNHPDILSVIVPMTDEHSLRVLFCCPDLYPLLRVILTSQDYWYERSQYLIGQTLTWRPKAAWKDVYCVLLHLRSGGFLFDIAPIDNLDSLLAVNETEDRFSPTYAETGNMHDCVRSRACHWYLSQTANTDVLEYVLQKEEGHHDLNLWDLVVLQLRNSHHAVVDKLLTLTSDDPSDHHATVVLIDAVQAGRRDIFDRFEHRIDDDVSIVRHLFAAVAEADDLEMYLYLLRTYGSSELESSFFRGVIAHDSITLLKYLPMSRLGEDKLLYAISIAITHSSMVALAYLASLTTLAALDWYEATKRALECDRINDETGVKYAIERIDPNRCLSGLLIASLGSPPAFKVLLADPRSHPELILGDLADAFKNLHPYVIQWLISDPRIRTETMEPSIVSSVWSLLESQRTRPSLEYIRQCHHQRTDPSLKYMEQLRGTESERYGVPIPELIRTDAYTLTVRHIIFKRPTDVELVDWMISLDNPIMARAACDTLMESYTCANRDAEEAGSIRALLLAMLYPSVITKRSIRTSEGGRIRALGVIEIDYTLDTTRVVSI